MHRLVICCRGAASSSDGQSVLAMQAHQAAVQVSLLSCYGLCKEAEGQACMLAADNSGVEHLP